MTIPTLVNSYQKQIVATKLQKFYTIMSQAIKLSEIDNGPTDQWFYGADHLGSDTFTFFNTYFAPYLRHSGAKITTNYVANDSVDFYIADGTKVKLWKDTSNMHVFVYLNSKTPPRGGKDLFIFFLKPDKFTPYDWHDSCSEKIGTREYWTCEPTFGCNKTSANKGHCAGLIMNDGWKISDDYPW